MKESDALHSDEVSSRAAKAFERFVLVIKKLRDPQGGCPWDLEQTHASLKPYLIEEAYEVLTAIDEQPDMLKYELGDVLLQVVLHAQVARDGKSFAIDEVVDAAADKMIRRHPHVFGDVSVENSGEVLRNWEKNKQRDLAGGQSILDGVPKSMPALLRAQRIGEKAARIGFEWPTLEGVRDKVLEEVREFMECVCEPQPDKRRLEDEFGDILFALSQLSRRLDLNSEETLNRATDKFILRFKEMERRAGRPLSEMTIEELDNLWEEVKAHQAKEARQSA